MLQLKGVVNHIRKSIEIDYNGSTISEFTNNLGATKELKKIEIMTRRI